MNKTVSTMALLLGPAMLGLALSGCGGPDGEPVTQTLKVEIPAEVFVASAPDGAQDVHDLKASDVAEGAEVVVSGKVGGALEPFSGARAVLTLATADGHIQSCDTRANDGCETPWDFCCDAPDAIMANTVTIQIVGADGRPLKASLHGEHGIDNLSVLTVKGTVGPRPDPNVLVINASAIHIAH